MTTVLDKNVHNLAVNGTFDDCQVSPEINNVDHRTLSNKSSQTTHLTRNTISVQ